MPFLQAPAAEIVGASTLVYTQRRCICVTKHAEVPRPICNTQVCRVFAAELTEVP